MKEPHTALFIAPTGVEKTHLALSLLETEYRNHFDFIVIICPTLRYNSTYKSRSWVWNDPDVIPIELGNNLYYLIEKISNLLAGDKTLFLIDDIIAFETLDKHRQPLLELAISGRHKGHSLWLLTQSYTAVPNNIRRQAKMLYVWYPKNRMDLNMIHEENDVIGLEELARVKAQLNGGTYLPNYEDGTPKSLYDLLSFKTGLLKDSYESPINSYKSPINLLSRDYKTPIKRWQDSYKFPIISYKFRMNLL